MSYVSWKDALWNLLELLPLRRMTARIALSAGLIGLASQATPDAVGQPRVPVSPMLTPEATVRKFKGRYVLRRSANAFFVHLAGHRSHSSHSSHASHTSHYSGSSHFSSSPSPAPPAQTAPEPAPPRSAPPQPAPPQPAPPRTLTQPLPPPRPKPVLLLVDAFDATGRVADRWRIGVLATPPETFDENIAVEQGRGLLSITPVAQKPGAHFSGYVSIQSFDLHTSSVKVELRRPAAGATTLFAAALDSENWKGFRIEGGRLSIESHAQGRVAAKTIPYKPAQHRFLRLRLSAVAPVVVWETSADGVNWNPEYVETSTIAVTALRVVLSAGTTKDTAEVTGPATFGTVTVEGRP